MRDDVIRVKTVWGSTAVTAIAINRPPPARLRANTQMTGRTYRTKNVRVRTQRPWRREEFFRYLEREIARARPPIPHVTRLAELAGLSPSTVSNWKNGKQRPTLDKLTAIAQVLGKPRSELWVEAGLVAGADVNADEPEERDPRLDGLDQNDPVVQHILALDLGDDEEMRGFMLDRRRQQVAEQRERDLREIEREIEFWANRRSGAA